MKNKETSIQNHKQLIIRSGNRTEGSSVAALCSNFSWACAVTHCQSAQFMSDSGLWVFLLMILSDPGAWEELAYKGVFVRGSRLSAKRW